MLSRSESRQSVTLTRRQSVRLLPCVLISRPPDIRYGKQGPSCLGPQRAAERPVARKKLHLLLTSISRDRTKRRRINREARGSEFSHDKGIGYETTLLPALVGCAVRRRLSRCGKCSN